MAKVLLLALTALLVWGYRNVRLRSRSPRPATPKPPARPSSRSEDPHDTLGVPRGASQAEIRDAYLERVREYHPDVLARAAPELRRLAERRMAAINAAYEALRRPG
ncbi:MAG: J domain-containing protein [Deltaproteobacteria bacterium]|nr:J domain-containing protein [Deltaproteobacteria bacterium]